MAVLLCSHHGNSLSAGAATAWVRGGVWLCSCAITMATAVSAGATTAGVRGGIGLCCCAASVITLVTVAAAKSESWNTYMVNDHRPAFLKPLTAFWTDAAFLYATFRISVVMLSLVCLHVLSPTSSVLHHSISQTVRKRRHPKAGVGAPEVHHLSDLFSSSSIYI